MTEFFNNGVVHLSEFGKPTYVQKFRNYFFFILKKIYASKYFSESLCNSKI